MDYKKIHLKKATGKVLYPDDWSECDIQIISTAKGTNTIYSQQISLVLGDTSSVIMYLIHDCVYSMSSGEEVAVYVPKESMVYKAAFDEVLTHGTPVECSSNFCDLPQVDGYSPLCIIQLCSFRRTKPVTTCTVEDILERASKIKENGTVLYKSREVEIAFRCFSKALKYLIVASVDNVTEDMKSQHQSLKNVCYLNLAACQLAKQNYYCVIENTSKCLKTDPDNVKGLYRRADAYKHTGDIEKALSDFMRIEKVEPTNKLVAKQIKELNSQMEGSRNELAKNLGKLFK